MSRPIPSTMPHTPPFSATARRQALELNSMASPTKAEGVHQSPPSSPTPLASPSLSATALQHQAALSLASLHIRTVSPPTPAPSPRPYGQATARYTLSSTDWSSQHVRHGSLSLLLDDLDDQQWTELMRSQFRGRSSRARQRLLEQLIGDCPPSALSPLLPLITPRLKRDFLKTLPLELAFHVLSFVDDVRTLARASNVSRFWRALLEDEHTWKRMCWSSGFGSGRSELGAATDSTDTAGLRLRNLEFGARADEDGTPAGRERRGTMDRSGLLEFAARAESLGLLHNASNQNATAWQVADVLPTANSLGGPALAIPTSTAGLGIASSFVDPSRQNHAPFHANLRTVYARIETPDDPAFDLHGYATSSTIAASPHAPSPHALSDEVRDDNLRPHRTAGAINGHVLLASPQGSPPLQALLLEDEAPSAVERVRVARSLLRSGKDVETTEKPFSFKSHFKTAYLTESAWLRGPGRLLSTQMSADDGVVTSLGFDGEWIVVGMATSKVHVFDAPSGSYVKTLEGHELGVWCLTLVSKGGGPRTPEAGLAEMADAGSPTTMAAAPSQLGSMRSRDDWSISGSPSVSTAYGLRGVRQEAPDVLVDDSFSPRDWDETTTGAAAPAFARRRRSFHSFGENASQSAPPSGSSSGASRAGGMGLGAGGETGDGSHQAGVCGTARGWGQNGAVIVTAGCDRDVRVWDVESGACQHILRGHTSTVRCMRVIDGRPIAVSGSRDSTLRVWDIETGKALHQLVGHEDSVRVIEVAGNKVISGSYDATCRLWDIDSGQCLFVYRGHALQIYAVAFDGVRVVTGSLDSTIRVWCAKTGAFLALLQGHTSLVGQLQLDPTTNMLVTGGSDGRVIIFDLSNFTTRHRLCAHDNSVTCLQFDRKYLISSGNDGSIRLWDVQTGAFIRELISPCESVWKVAVRDDMWVVLCRKENRTIMDVRTFRPLNV